MPYGKERVDIRYDEAKEHILDADVLLYRGMGGLFNQAIRTLSLSEYAHAAMAGWTNGDSLYRDLMAYEMLWTGGQGHTLVSHVEKRKSIDVYRCADTHTVYSWDADNCRVIGKTYVLDRKAALKQMRSFCRPEEYGRMHLWMTALTRLPVLRFLFPQPTADELADRTRPPYCSEAVAYALRSAFTDVVRNTPDHYTTPGALACSPLLHYMFTIVP